MHRPLQPSTRWGTVLAGALAAVAGGGCVDEPGPLSRAAIEDLSRRFGDGEGETWSGVYRMAPRDIDCDCKTLDAGAIVPGLDPEFVPCETLVQVLIGSGSNAALGGSSQRVELLQHDGYLAFLFETPLDDALELGGPLQFTGPIGEDGEAEVGGMVILEALDTGARLAWRYELSLFVNDDGGPGFEGRARVRAFSNVPDAEANCLITTDLEGEAIPEDEG